MKINPHHSLNFEKVKKKVLTREPILVTQITHPLIVNNEFCLRATGKTNSQLDNQTTMTDEMAQVRAKEFERLILKQQLAKNRSGDILERLQDMERLGYDGILDDVPAKIYNALLKLDKKTISALNDCQLFRICYAQDVNRSVVDGLQELEKEFSYDELLRLSQSDNSTILNTWIVNQTRSEKSFECLTEYIHQISRR